MPSTLNNKLKRLFLIFKRLQSSNQTKQELLEMLDDHGLNIKAATFERDKKTFKDEFGVDLLYNAHDKTYSLEKMNDNEMALIINFFQYHQIANSINESLSDRKSSLDFIDFENEYQLQGIEHLDKLFSATKNQQVIKFKHRRFETDKSLEYTIKPYLVKQYQSRWYIIGENKHQQIRSFGIDRIQTLVVTTETFAKEDYELKEKYKACIGISNIQEERQLIKLQFDYSQQEYMEHLPLHHSQKCIEESKEGVVYEYYLIDNFEFRQHILKYGQLV